VHQTEYLIEKGFEGSGRSMALRHTDYDQYYVM